MYLYRLDNGTRQYWPGGHTGYSEVYKGMGTTVVAVGGTEPDAPASLPDCTHVIKYDPSGGVVMTNHHFVQSSKVTISAWLYIKQSSWGSQTTYRLFEASSYFGGAYARSRMEANVSQATVDTAKWKLTCSFWTNDRIMAGGVTWMDAKNAGATVEMPFNAWYRIVLSVTPATTPISTNGSATISIYNDAGALLGTLTNAACATGTDPISTLSIRGMSVAGGRDTIIYAADVDITDDVPTINVPGVLCPLVHPCENGTSRITLVCDRPVSGVFSYGVDAATEHTATAEAMAFDDGGRLLRFRIDNVVPGQVYKWQVQLTDKAAPANTATVTGIDGRHFAVLLKPLDSQESVIAGVSDNHSTSMPLDARNWYWQMAKGVRGLPGLVAFTGDCLDTDYVEPRSEDDVYSLRHIFAGLWRWYRYLGGNAVFCFVHGNHDGDGSALAQTYVDALINRPADVARLQAFRFGTVDVLALDCHVHTTPTQLKALLEGDFTDALAASKAPHRLILMHDWVVQSDNPRYAGPEGHYGAMTVGGGYDNPALIHALLKAYSNVACWGGHVHVGNYYLRDGVTYVTVPPLLIWNKLDPAPVRTTNGAGAEPGSLYQTIADYGANGCNGWLYSVWGSGWARHMMWDSAVVGNAFVVRKGLDQIRLTGQV